MKKLISILACCIACFAVAATSRAEDQQEESGAPLNILFIGNSFTFYNSLNGTVEDMLNVSGVPATATRSAPGGWRLRQHFNGEIPSKYQGAPTPDAIRSKKWDVVVLQEQSAGSVDARAEFLEYGKKLVDLIREQNPDVRILLYQTWGRCDGMFEGYGEDDARKAEVLDAWTKRYSAPDDATVEALKDGIQGGYAKLAELTGARVAPVGKAFFTVGDKLDLYSDEGDKKPFHPNPLGTYLAGCVFYKMIVGQSPVGLYQRLKDAGKKYKLTQAEAEELEKIADQTMETLAAE